VRRKGKREEANTENIEERKYNRSKEGSQGIEDLG